MILFTENPKESTKNLLQLINEFSKVTRYKINVQKSIAFLYTNNEPEKEIKKSIPFIIAPVRIKYLGINLTMEMKDLYSENYQILMKENGNTNEWKDISCSWIGRILLRCAYYPKQSTYLMQTLSKY
uniref:Reverse transcriptase domain-containing protein n=1 Tax=Ursus americanus TaxID=9643 RepID=A0A452RT43_URSAM